MLIRTLRVFRFADYKDYKDYRPRQDGGGNTGYKGNNDSRTNNQFAKRPYQNNFSGGGQANRQGGFQQQNIIESSIDIKNYNIQIALEKYNLSLFLMSPSIVKKSATVFEIRRNSPVMGMMFVPKSEGADENHWNQRKSITFKLPDLGKLLYVQPGKGKSTTISSEVEPGYITNNTPQFYKQFVVTDNAAKSTINFILREKPYAAKPTQQQGDKPLECSASYQEYKFIYQLIRCSLFQVSGWKFQMDIHKRDIFNKLDRKGDQDLDNISYKGRID